MKTCKFHATVNKLNWKIGDYLNLVPVPWYGNICVVSMAGKSNQYGKKIKERKSTYNIVKIQICDEHDQKRTADIEIIK